MRQTRRKSADNAQKVERNYGRECLGFDLRFEGWNLSETVSCKVLKKFSFFLNRWGVRWLIIGAGNEGDRI